MRVGVSVTTPGEDERGTAPPRGVGQCAEAGKEPAVERIPPREDESDAGHPQHGEADVTARAVAAVMPTALFAIAVDETVLMAWELMERSGSHHLPAVQVDGRCAGLLDRGDLAIACAAPAVSLSGRRVRDLLLGRRPAVIHAEESVGEAVALMRRTRVEALPVLGEHGRLVGLLTAMDLVAVLAGHPVRSGPTGPRSQVPFPVMPGLEPRGRDRGTAVP